ncbi:MAG: hypothetical protein V3T35_00190, partial [Spirochaetia bacterium]
MSDDQRNPDNTDASSPSDQDQSPEAKTGDAEQAFFEDGGQPTPEETAPEETAPEETAEPQPPEPGEPPLPEASLEDDVEITTQEPVEMDEQAEGEAPPTTPPPEVRLSPD